MPVPVHWILPAVVVVVLTSCGDPGHDGPPRAHDSSSSARASDDRPTGHVHARAPRTELTIVGDIMLGRGVAVANPGSDPAAPLRPMAPLLGGADLTVGNLESTLSDDGPPRQGD